MDVLHEACGVRCAACQNAFPRDNEVDLGQGAWASAGMMVLSERPMDLGR